MKDTEVALHYLHGWETAVGGAPQSTVADGLAVSVLNERTGEYEKREELVADSIRAHALLAWARDGFQTFRVTHGLAAALLLTDSDEAPTSDLQFPFTAFRLDFPGPNYPVGAVYKGQRLGIESAVIHIVEGPREPADYSAARLAGLDKHDDEIERIRADYPETMEGKQQAVRDMMVATVAAVEAASEGKPRGRIVEIILNLAGDKAVMLGLHIDRLNAPTVGAMLDALAAQQAMHQPDWATAEQQQVTRDLALLFIQFLANFVLYVNRLDAPEGKARYGKQVRASPVRTPQRPVTVVPSVWLIGQDVKLPKEIREAALASTIYPGQARRPWELHAQHIVRGHMKRQFCGPGRADRRRIWIAPYKRGPDVGVITSRTYDVGLTAGEEG